VDGAVGGFERERGRHGRGAEFKRRAGAEQSLSW
jgi:hypothetical protein